MRASLSMDFSSCFCRAYKASPSRVVLAMFYNYCCWCQIWICILCEVSHIIKYFIQSLDAQSSKLMCIMLIESVLQLGADERR